MNFANDTAAQPNDTLSSFTSTQFFTTHPEHSSPLQTALGISESIQDITNGVNSIVWLLIFLHSFRTYSRRHTLYTTTIVITALYPFGYTVKYGIDIFMISVYGADWHSLVLNTIIQKLCFVVTAQIFYLSMLLKLKYAFKGSVYELSNCMLYILSALLCIGVSLDIVYFTTRGIAKETGRISEDISFHLNWIRSIFNVCFGSLFIACFTRKLLEFVTATSRMRRFESSSQFSSIGGGARASISSPRSSAIQEEKRNLSRQQRDHLQVAVKFVLLHGIAIICTNVQFSGWTLVNFELIDTEEATLWFILLWSWLWDVVLFVNYYTIWLSFPFAKQHYMRVCRMCDRCCLDACSMLVAARMAKHAEEADASRSAIQVTSV